jgi:SAM-dependent methyltransferase
VTAVGSSPTAPAWEPVTRAAGIRRGAAVLDVGCGRGGFCAYAASRGARVHGADADPAGVSAARRAVPGGDFRVADMARLPWPDGAFDVVTGFNAFQYAPDVDAALLEAFRVAGRPGRVAACKWGPPAANAFFAFLGALDPARLTLAGPTVDVLDAAILRVGADVVAEGAVPAPIAFSGVDALRSALEAAGAHAGGQEDDADWHARVIAAAAPYREAGGYRFDNQLVYRVLSA